MDKTYKGREWTHDDTHNDFYYGCFTCEQIRTGIDLRIEAGIEPEFFGNAGERC